MLKSGVTTLVALLLSNATLTLGQDSEVVMTSTDLTGWRVSVSNEWDVLGPFPIHAREQHFLSPSYPLNLSTPIDYDMKWPSAYADNGEVGWSKATMSRVNLLEVSFPDIRWSSLRATEGWAALQHHTLLRTTITVHSPPEGSFASFAPNLHVSITQGSFFTLLPRHEGDIASMETVVPKWYAGNIYGMAASTPHTVPLPAALVPSHSVTYDLFVSGDYEIRLFGDPLANGSEVPKLSIGVSVGIELRPQHSLLHVPNHDVIPNYVNGWAFGDAIGVGLRSSGGWWVVTSVKVRDKEIAEKVSVGLLQETRIAPSQARRVPVTLSQLDAFTGSVLPLEFTVLSEDGLVQHAVNLPVKQLPLWTASSFTPLIATYFAESTAMPFVAVPPKEKNGDKALPPLLFLHGAGLNVLDLDFWLCAPPRQARSWVILPTGRTEWGLDWHGPSTTNAWESVTALSSILHSIDHLHAWKYPEDTRVVLLGHSNGGQGAWHVAGRFPDKVVAVVPAAAYMKSQAYVPLLQSRSAHFVDPILRAILESSLTPDDNDLFLSNLVDTPVLAIHGGDDENVPVWHTRALVDTLKTWNKDANVTFREDPGQPHCYTSAFENEHTQAFIDESLRKSGLVVKRHKSFTLTVAIPSESGSLHGVRILALETPGRLARLTVVEEDKATHIFTRNVQAFSVQVEEGYLPPSVFKIQGQELIARHALTQDRKHTVFAEHDGIWTVGYTDEVHIQPSGRMSAILSSKGPLQIVVPDKSERFLSAATRLAHSLDVHHKIDANILEVSEFQASGSLGDGNIVIITDGTDGFLSDLLAAGRTPFSFSNETLTLNGRPVKAGSSAVFLHTHPTNPDGLALVLYADTEPGLERALRLFPIRTGLTVPDWIIISQEADKTGAGGVQGAGVYGNNWSWNGAMSSF